ncbi:MAG: dihydropteroate synthase [Desulfobulbaceae bacterium A2]|nr:MAG: dihydropteroate synthase [Desulfobulbaceae bacterium A2]
MQLTPGHRTLIMGILNVTPDSFSDGGTLLEPATLEARIREMIAGGADILDVGGESTRPFAAAVTLEEELARVLPAIRCIRRVHAGIPVSIDTTKAAVARAALAAGADMVNDISALRQDPAMIDVVREYDGPVIIMHMQGSPRDMQLNPSYGDVVAEVRDFLAARRDWLSAHGVAAERVVLDPGIGFGKSMEHNLQLLARLSDLRHLGQPILVGHSRKSFLGTLLDLKVDQRDEATATLSAICALRGADIVRVHNVPATRRALLLAEAIRRAECS